MWPSRLRIVASATFCFDDGMRTSSCMAVFALRMRVSMSAIGSVIVIVGPSPACLGDAGDLTGMDHLAQTDPGQDELAEYGSSAATPPAARVGAHLELGLALL